VRLHRVFGKREVVDVSNRQLFLGIGCSFQSVCSKRMPGNLVNLAHTRHHSHPVPRWFSEYRGYWIIPDTGINAIARRAWVIDFGIIAPPREPLSEPLSPPGAGNA
jgi:hypothetical protein